MDYIIPSAALQVWLGRQGENRARTLIFDIAEWQALGHGLAHILLRRPGENTPYPVACTVSGSQLVWTVLAADNALAGLGSVELQYIVDEIVIKSRTLTAVVDRALSPPGEAPDPPADWVNQVLAAADEVMEATVHAPVISAAGTWMTWDQEAGDYVDTGLPSRGPEGQQGSAGAPGKSAYAAAAEAGYSGTEAEFNRDLAEVSSKETAMVSYTEIPAGGVLVSNGHYTLSADQDLEVSLPTGSTADDMIYLSVLATGTLRMVISGINYAPATDIRLRAGDFAELVATWQPVASKWLLASRVVIGA